NGFWTDGSGATQASGAAAKTSTGTARPKRLRYPSLSTDPALFDHRNRNIPGKLKAATGSVPRHQSACGGQRDSVGCESARSREDLVKRTGDDHAAARLQPTITEARHR